MSACRGYGEKPGIQNAELELGVPRDGFFIRHFMERVNTFIDI